MGGLLLDRAREGRCGVIRDLPLAVLIYGPITGVLLVPATWVIYLAVAPTRLRRRREGQ